MQAGAAAAVLRDWRNAEPLQFGRCLVPQLGLADCSLEDAACHGVEIMCSVEQHADGAFVFRAGAGRNALPFFHAEQCPGKGVHGPSTRQVRMAVCCIVEVGEHVLLTRRASTMSAFASVWVLPGGHVDAGESLAAAAVRELREETGIDVDETALIPFAFYGIAFRVVAAFCSVLLTRIRCSRINVSGGGSRGAYAPPCCHVLSCCVARLPA